MHYQAEGRLIGPQTAIGSLIDQNPTVEENIDRKIKYHQSEIDRLTKSKEALGPLLNMRIGDIRQAMDY